jgi:hypothetical protein
LLAHPEVNANVFLALRDTHLDQFINYDLLIRTQNERGFWSSYFYPTPFYGTLLALDVLHGNPSFGAATERALAFVIESQNADGSWGDKSDPYETALAIATLLDHPVHAGSMQRGVEHLLSVVAEDGSWTSRSCVWTFPRQGDLWRAYDIHRAFVSACCLRALRRVARQLTRFP